MAAPSWITIDDVKNDQGLDCQITTRDDTALQRCIDAAMSWVMEIRPELDYHGSWTVPAHVRLGTVRLAARWFTRRISPNGTVQLGDLSAGTVIKTDPDIWMQIGVVGGLA